MYSNESKLIVISFFAVIILFSSFAFGQGPELTTGEGCQTVSAITKRTGGDFTDAQGRINSIYDISITNIGSCDAFLVSVLFSLPAGSQIVNKWNLENQEQTKNYAVTGYGENIPKDTTYIGSGLVIAFSNTVDTPRSVSVSVVSTSCPSSCIDANQNAVDPIDTSSSPSISSTTCPATATAALRNTYKASITEAKINLVYDLVITNNSPYPIDTLDIYIPLRVNGTVIQSWNMEKTCCTQIVSVVGFNVSLFSLPSSQTSKSAGFILSIPQESYDSNTAPPTIDVVNPSTGVICGF